MVVMHCFHWFNKYEYLYLGNFDQVFNRNAWGFHEHLGKAYGAAVRIKGFFGVSSLSYSDPF